jgi:hypothetical protein
VSYVISHGRKIEYTTINPDGVAPKRRKRIEPFVQFSLAEAAALAKAVRNPALLVIAELKYAAWKAKGAPFRLPNARLRKLGVSREITRRTLRNLERDGIITVTERRPGCTAVVTYGPRTVNK